MDYQEYWIGKGIDLNKLWNSYEEGLAYTSKFDRQNYYELIIQFKKYDEHEPIFNFEVIHKTLKSLYHTLKIELLSTEEYNASGPLFMEEVVRGSEVWKLLVEKHSGLLYVFAFLGAINSIYQFDQSQLDSLETKLRIIEEHFPEASSKNKSKFIDAWNFHLRNKAIKNLINEGVTKIEMSKTPVASIDSTKIILFESTNRK